MGGPISQINAITQLTIFKSQKHPQSNKIFLAGTDPQTQLESVFSANYLFPMKCWNRSQTSFWLLADATLQVMKMLMVGWIFTVKIIHLPPSAQNCGQHSTQDPSTCAKNIGW